MKTTNILVAFLVIFIIHEYAVVATSKSLNNNDKQQPEKSTNEKKPPTEHQKRVMKEKKEKRQKEAKEKFHKQKSQTQLDRGFGKSVMRADKTGGKLLVQRKGQVLAMRIKDVIEKHANGTQVCNLDHLLVIEKILLETNRFFCYQ